MRNTVVTAAMAALLQIESRGVRRVKETPDSPKDHSAHVARAQSKRERKLARNRKIQEAS